MASIVIGIMGKKRSGKDTFAARLVNEHGYTRLAFADALKESLLELDPIVRVEGDEVGIVFGPGECARTFYPNLATIVHDIGWERAKTVREVRRLLQRHGVAMRNHVGENVWVDALAAKADAIAGPVVITDVRFPNEADRVEQTGGTLVRIVRPSLVSTDTHISETALDTRDSDYLVYNDRDVAALHQQADSIADSLSPFGGY